MDTLGFMSASSAFGPALRARWRSARLDLAADLHRDVFEGRELMARQGIEGEPFPPCEMLDLALSDEEVGARLWALPASGTFIPASEDTRGTASGTSLCGASSGITRASTVVRRAFASLS